MKSDKTSYSSQMATEQTGFRPGKGTVEQIFSIRLLAENHQGMLDGVLYHFSLTSNKPLTEFGMKAYGEYYTIMAFNQNQLTSCKNYTTIPEVQSLWEGACNEFTVHLYIIILLGFLERAISLCLTKNAHLLVAKLHKFLNFGLKSL